LQIGDGGGTQIRESQQLRDRDARERERVDLRCRECAMRASSTCETDRLSLATTSDDEKTPQQSLTCPCGVLTGSCLAPWSQRSRARTHIHRAPPTPHTRTNTHTPRPPAAAARQQSMSMSMLQHKHTCSVRAKFSMHSTCSGQWARGRPSQGTFPAACSAPAHPRDRTSPPARSKRGGKRGDEEERCDDAMRGRSRRETCSDTRTGNARGSARVPGTRAMTSAIKTRPKPTKPVPNAET